MKISKKHRCPQIAGASRRGTAATHVRNLRRLQESRILVIWLYKH